MWPLLALAAAAACSDDTCDAVGLLQLRHTRNPTCREKCPAHCDENEEHCDEECDVLASDACTACAEKTGCVECLECYRGLAARGEIAEEQKEQVEFDAAQGTSLLETGASADPDKSPHCAGWAAAGECDKNPAYMDVNCATTCAAGKSGGGGAAELESSLDDLAKDVDYIKKDVATIKANQNNPPPPPSNPRRRTPSPTPAPRRRRTPSPTPAPRRRRSGGG